MLEKILFVLAMAGSVVIVLERLSWFFMRIINGTAAKVQPPATVIKKTDEGSKKEPSFEGFKKNSDELQTLIELLGSQSEEINKLSKIVAETSARLSALESPKPRLSRKSPAKAHDMHVAAPSSPVNTGFEGLPPVVSGGFEPVH